MPPTIHAEGLKDLRKDLRALGKAEPRELTKSLKAAAEVALPLARELAPRRTGRLAASLRSGAAGTRASIRSRLPYANVIHWGGTTGRGHERGKNRGSVHIKASRFALSAIERESNKIVDTLADGIEELAKRHGWH